MVLPLAPGARPATITHAAMTLFEAVAVLVLLALGALGSMIGATYLGAVGYLLGFLVGFFALPLLLAAFAALDERLFAGPLPHGVACPCGDSARTAERHPTHGYVDRCACARMFVWRRGRVFLVSPSGSLVPFRRWHFLRGWVAVGQQQQGTPYR